MAFGSLKLNFVPFLFSDLGFSLPANFYYFTCLGFIGFGLDGDSEEINFTNDPTWRGPSSKASFYELIRTASASF